MEMDVTPAKGTTTDIAPMNVLGWKFEFINTELWITSDDDPNAQVHLSAQAAFSLLDYLYQYREKIHEAAQVPQGESTQQQ